MITFSFEPELTSRERSMKKVLLLAEELNTPVAFADEPSVRSLVSGMRKQKQLNGKIVRVRGTIVGKRALAYFPTNAEPINDVAVVEGKNKVIGVAKAFADQFEPIVP